MSAAKLSSSSSGCVKIKSGSGFIHFVCTYFSWILYIWIHYYLKSLLTGPWLVNTDSRVVKYHLIPLMCFLYTATHAPLKKENSLDLLRCQAIFIPRSKIQNLKLIGQGIILLCNIHIKNFAHNQQIGSMLLL